MLVLVVDDDRAVREALERALQLHGYEVALASDGTRRSRPSTRTPDAVVLDVMMPGLDGLDVTRRLRRQGNRIPILLLTARDAVGDRVEGLDAAPTTTCRSRTTSRSCSRGCARSCAARSRRSRARCSASPT
jgi:Response regulators consisting of a CheY-like receiver domain and a winged-helix DNA-binding domain